MPELQHFSRCLSRSLLDREYRDIPRFHSYCRDCCNFNKNWSCPGENFTIEDYLKQYPQLLFIVLRWNFTEAERDLSSPLCRELRPTPAGTRSSSRKYSAASELLSRFSEIQKKDILRRCLAAEKAFPAVLALSAGACSLCPECAKVQALPCRKPQKHRFSLEALGYDVAKILREHFSLNLEWSGERLPRCLTLMLAFALPPFFTQKAELEAAFLRA